MTHVLLVASLLLAATGQKSGTQTVVDPRFTIKDVDGTTSSRATSVRLKNLVDHTSGWVNVKSYGAKGDGTTDDTLAIQAAIAAANANPPKAVVFPAGIYNVSSTLTVTYTKWRMVSTGGYAVLQGNANADVLNITGPGGSMENIHIGRTDGTTGNGLYLAAPENTFIRLRVSGKHTNGIILDGSGAGTHLNKFYSLYVNTSQFGTGINDLGRSIANDFFAPEIYNNNIGVIWESEAHFYGGSIEQSLATDILLGTQPLISTKGAVAIFDAVHFERATPVGPTDALVKVGPVGQTTNTVGTFRDCVWSGNSGNMAAVSVQGGRVDIVGGKVSDFTAGGHAVWEFTVDATQASTIFPVSYYNVAAAHRSENAAALVSSFDFLDNAKIRLGNGNMYWQPAAPNTISTNGAILAGAQIQTNSAMRSAQVSPAYGSSVAINANNGNLFSVVANNGTAFTITNPTNGTAGQFITVRVKNTSGGALGAVTWDTAYKLATWASPANGFNRSITFEYDGSFWYEVSRTTTDVTN